MTLSILAWLATIGIILKSRNSRGASLSGLDKLAGLLALATLIQFGPMLSSSLHAGHNVYTYSQTGCKLLFYTEYGTRHVITALVCSMLAYAYYGLHHGFESVSGRLNTAGMGWIILFLAAVQGLFGMVPAMYVDLSLDEQSCSWTHSMHLTLGQIVSMELVLRSLSPYLVPALFLVYPILQLLKLLPGVTEPKKIATVRTILYVSVSYFIFNSPYAVNLIVEYALKLSITEHNMVAVCNLKWFFFLIHQAWFLAAPLMMLIGDPSAEIDTEKLSFLVTKLKKITVSRV